MMRIGVSRRPAKSRRLSSDWLPYTYLIFIGTMTFLPFWLMLINSVKTRAQFQVSSVRPMWPMHFMNYYYTSQIIWRPLFITAVVSVVAIIGALTISSLSAYAFARFKFPGDQILFFSIIMLLMIPGILTLVPRYVIIARLGLSNSLWALIIPYMSGGQIFQIFVLRTFFESLPQDLFDAGRIDGASDFRIYYGIVLPLSQPILGTLAILQMMSVKDDFIWPLVTLTSRHLRTITLQLRFLEGEFGTEWGLIMAGYTLACIPFLIIFALFTRPFIQGMTSGAIKM